MWIAFSLSDASRPMLGGTERPSQQIYGSQMPLGLAEFLKQNPPRETAFVPAGWGDWLYRQTDASWQPFATSRVEALPRQVWIDYSNIASSQGGWRNVLRRYKIKTLIVDRKQQQSLVTGLRLDPAWTSTYQDSTALVFTKNNTTPTSNQTSEGSND